MHITETVLSVLIVFGLSFETIESYSYNLKSKIIYSPDHNLNDAYFGYSVMLKLGDPPLIIVGAPRDYKDLPSYKNISEPGTIYTCKFNETENISKCVQLIVDSDRNEFVSVANGKNIHSLKNNMWLGMSLDGTDNYNTTIMCAPRWSNQLYQDQYLMNGLCYMYDDLDLDNYDEAKMMSPLTSSDKQETTLTNEYVKTYYGNVTSLYSLGQAGFSAKLSEDGEELILGAPGIYAWTGSVIKMTRRGDSFDDQVIPNTYFTPEVKQGSYLGYSVNMGNFITKHHRSYVAGAPRGSQLKGMVYIFDFPETNDESLIIHSILEGKQMGEYFGSTIAAVDIDGDGLTDLLIGAPMFSKDDASEMGKVYVYLNKDKGNFFLEDSDISGNCAYGARFGSSISVIGDLNHDGFPEIAIGAPFENNGVGAVYIYLGTVEGLKSKYVQRISFDNMRGFGISISKGVDIDYNHCNDIAIGAHDSNKVVLLRCHPSARITFDMETFPSHLNMHDRNFSLHWCAKFQESAYKTDLDLTLSIDNDYKRATIHDVNDLNFTMSGTKGDVICKDVLVDIEVKNVDYSRPLKIQIDYQIKKDPFDDDQFCKECMILPPEERHVIHNVPFSVGCGHDNVCHPDLKLTVIPLTVSPYVIGTSPFIIFNVTIENHGEPAFLAKIKIQLPAIANLQRIPSDCFIENINELICNVGNPMLHSTQKFIIISFETKNLKNEYRALEFNVNATSGGEEVEKVDNFVKVNHLLETKADVSLIGISEPYERIYVDPNIKQHKKTIEHSFKLTNDGPSQLDSITMRFFIPTSLYDEPSKQFYNLIKLYSPKITNTNDIIECRAIRGKFHNSSSKLTFGTFFRKDVEDYESKHVEYIKNLTTQTGGSFTLPIHFNCTNRENVRCTIVQCNGTLSKIDTVLVSFDMIVNMKIISNIINDEDSLILSIYSTMESDFTNRKTKWTRSLLSESMPSPPFWIYLVSLVIGILVLAFAVYVLYKFDFFKRKQKTQLKLLKNEEFYRDDEPAIEDEQ